MEGIGVPVAARASPPGGLPLAVQIRRARRLAGWAIAGTGAVLLWADLLAGLAAADARVQGALWGGTLAAVATALGTVPVLLRQQYSERARDVMLGFGAGVMLAACSFSLIIPGLEAAREQGFGVRGGAALIGGSVLLGALLMMALDRWLPHEHFIKGVEGRQATLLRRSWLFALAIILHNVPEGLAIGVAFAGADPAAAKALSAGIAIQDIPEGLAVALALRAAGYSRTVSAGIGMASGLVEPVAALAGVLLLGMGAALLPAGLATAAGAMLYVISHEIIPESHRAGHERWATGGLMVGFVLMMVLDTAG